MYFLGNYVFCLFYVVMLWGIFCNVVMFCIVLQVKKDMVWCYGGVIIECEFLIILCEEMFVKVQVCMGGDFVYFYNDLCVIVGQGICVLELMEQIVELDGGGLDVVVVFIGGGGMILGICLIFVMLVFDVQVIVVELEQVDDVYCSFKVGYIIVDDVLKIIVDGLLVLLKDLIWYFVSNYVSQIYIVLDVEIIDVMKLIWKYLCVVMEFFSVVLLVMILKNCDVFVGKCVGIIIIGGNVDFDCLFWI